MVHFNNVTRLAVDREKPVEGSKSRIRNLDKEFPPITIYGQSNFRLLYLITTIIYGKEN